MSYLAACSCLAYTYVVLHDPPCMIFTYSVFCIIFIIITPALRFAQNHSTMTRTKANYRNYKFCSLFLGNLLSTASRSALATPIIKNSDVREYRPKNRMKNNIKLILKIKQYEKCFKVLFD